MHVFLKVEKKIIKGLRFWIRGVGKGRQGVPPSSTDPGEEQMLAV